MVPSRGLKPWFKCWILGTFWDRRRFSNVSWCSLLFTNKHFPFLANPCGIQSPQMPLLVKLLFGGNLAGTCGFCLDWNGNRTSSDPLPPEIASTMGTRWTRPPQVVGRLRVLGRMLLTFGKHENSCPWFLVEMTNQNQSISLGKVRGKNSFPSKNDRGNKERRNKKIFRMAQKWYA